MNPTMAVLGLAGACALSVSLPAQSNPPAAPLPAAQAISSRQALDELEAQAPKEFKDDAALAVSHTRVATLVERNGLETADDFRRAAMLLQVHRNDYRVIRMQYELMLTAAAMGDAFAQKTLPMTWDQLMNRSGRAHRFDFGGWAQLNPMFAEYDPAPGCIQAVWRDPAAARAAVAGVPDNPEILAIRDADQADRRANWGSRTEAERQATQARDIARNTRMREIIAEAGVRTAADFSRAALVMQHSARFDGFRLAHELAVASMLLGDRQTGRWLVAASYDRMLHSTGLDQRFGTQRGPDGPLRVDEAGFCDNQRVALGCPTLAAARSVSAAGAASDQATLAMMKPGNVMEDPKFAVRANYPEGWTMVLAVPVNSRATSVRFDVPGQPDTSFAFYYGLLDQPQPRNRAEAEALLRKHVATKEKERQQRVTGYVHRPDGFAYAPANGNPAVRWIADYPRDGKPWCEYLVRILGPNSVGLLFLNAPADQIEALRPAVDAMADTVQLP